MQNYLTGYDRRRYGVAIVAPDRQPDRPCAFRHWPPCPGEHGTLEVSRLAGLWTRLNNATQTARDGGMCV